MRSKIFGAWRKTDGERLPAGFLRPLGAAFLLGAVALGAVTVWRGHEARQLRLARLLQEELHENRILRARQAALLDRAFELAKRVDAEAARWEGRGPGDIQPARTATEEICREAEAAASSLEVGEVGIAPAGEPAPALARCAHLPFPRAAAQLRAAL